ncbi:hypothetical protein EPUS_04724 [Endocarpon pusillum Z07020]|uniref:Heterokaryon incompatibility domain-containing protein n=1 Tax=Endocarpon pusillum (strain Z07020 / HMAS-L-300199) TaxID=1263415 RepID=U1GFC6_ENDPU|nr:uncharacterized protein EPUS_04724 [Endocarpon pusillum Z07020]ERF70446.1 hypothetical protein EPUS_04724 [Endocarpon pusillum Z07020]
MTSGWNLEKIKAFVLTTWHHGPQNEQPCPVCNSLQRVSTWNSVPDKGGVLFFTTTASLKASAAECTVCEVFHVALTKYPWAPERPSSRILRQNNDQNQVIVSDRLPWSYLAPFHPLSVNPSSEVNFRLLHKWIIECKSVHKSCNYRVNQTLPTRVIELLTNSHIPKLRLTNSTGMTGLYCALSHCWGRLEGLKLTNASSSSLQQSISWESLPKTFQDALIVTRNVGVRYLWIDALCILQDDAADWAFEAANMAAVYSNAFLVIAGSSAPDGSVGCFTERKQMPCVKVRSKSGIFSLRDIRPKIFVRERLEHVDFDPNHLHTNTDLEPLLGRAWAFQERWLAARILHYASKEMIWECRSSMHCECGGCDKEEDNRVIDLQSDSIHSEFDPMRAVAKWFVIVENYTARSLRIRSDKLIALAGIARQSRNAALGRYLAGIWEVAFVRSLLWCVVRRHQDHPFVRSRNAYVAPSWSWASVDSPVQYGYVKDFRGLVDAEAVEVDCRLGSPDEHGQVTGGYAVMRARLTKLKLVNNGCESEEEDGYGGRVVPPQVSGVDGLLLNSIWLDVDLYEGRDYCSDGQPLLGALIMIDPLDAQKCSALILRPSRPHEKSSETGDCASAFVRIGVTTGARVSTFENEKQTITII